VVAHQFYRCNSTLEGSVVAHMVRKSGRLMVSEIVVSCWLSFVKIHLLGDLFSLTFKAEAVGGGEGGVSLS
jgi:hypothetical protein